MDDNNIHLIGYNNIRCEAIKYFFNILLKNRLIFLMS